MVFSDLGSCNEADSCGMDSLGDDNMSQSEILLLLTFKWVAKSSGLLSCGMLDCSSALVSPLIKKSWLSIEAPEINGDESMLRTNLFGLKLCVLVVMVGFVDEYGKVGMAMELGRFAAEVEAAVEAINIRLTAAFDLRVLGVVDMDECPSQL